MGGKVTDVVGGVPAAVIGGRESEGMPCGKSLSAAFTRAEQNTKYKHSSSAFPHSRGRYDSATDGRPSDPPAAIPPHATFHYSKHQQTSDMEKQKDSRPSEGRKSSKPIMEKRRRARINDSLNQLKTLILDALKKDSSRHSKLEKADILEMTVKHLRNMQRQHVAAAVSTDPNVLGQYRAGFNECMTEVSSFLGSASTVETEVHQRLLNHLAGCCHSVSPVTSTYTNPTVLPAASASAMAHGRPVQVQVPAAASTTALPVAASAVNLPRPNLQLSPPEASCSQPLQAKVYGGIPLVSGQIGGAEPVAVLLPSQVFSGGQMPSHLIPVYTNPTVLTGASYAPPAGLLPQNGHVQPSVQDPTVSSIPPAMNIMGLPTSAAPVVTQALPVPLSMASSAQSTARSANQQPPPVQLQEPEKMWRPW
ncbi:transcription factor HES-1-B-like [Branchiostoma lanceolatum]|uniref:transcription factor HES-1-B-like n=1 Tax=Branchiostoma lanceolatum TaxID=7740 RepID=UPI00345539AF